MDEGPSPVDPAEDPRVAHAIQFIHRLDEATLNDQRRLVAIPGPTGDERDRAEYMRSRFLEIGLADARIDGAGNVIATLPRPSAAPTDERPIVAAAHLDSVFARETTIQVRNVGQRLFAPGISDNARGLAATLTLAEAMLDANVDTIHPIVFAATVGEEGVGDLRGVKHLFREGGALRDAAAFVAVDGPGRERIVHKAIGSLRYRVTISGLGGHSWGDRGTANAIHAAGLAIARLRTVGARAGGDVALNVGRIGGGTSINSIPESAWIEVDLRGTNRETLLRVEQAVVDAVDAAVYEENREARGRGALGVDIVRIGDRPAGETPIGSPLLQAAISATRAVGGTPELASSSTDANVPISLGIPAIAIGAGGIGGRTHTLDEWYENEKGPLGIERAARVLYAAAGIA